MCWKTSRPPIKKIAESDLKVYKILTCIENRIVSPIKSEFAWELNKTYKTELDSPKYYIHGRVNVINCGFHSLLDSPILYTSSFRHFKIWKTKYLCDIIYYDEGECVFEAVIPKGSKYYENGWGEIVSNQLKIIGKYTG